MSKSKKEQSESAEDVKRKIKEGVYRTFEKPEKSKKELWNYFEGSLYANIIKLRN